MPYVASVQVDERSPAEVLVERLIDRERGNATDGTVEFAHYQPGARAEPLRCTTAEVAIWILSGDGTLHTAAPDSSVSEGAVVLAAAGTWHGLSAGALGLSTLTIYDAPSNTVDTGLERRNGSQLSGEVPKQAHIASDEGSRFHDPALGGYNLRSWWLVTDQLLGSRQMMVGQSCFADTESVHELHRHPHAGEFLYVREGHGVHIIEEGEIPMGPGDVVYIPAGEWHGFRNVTGTPVYTVFGYLGAASLDGVGYEVLAS